MNIIKECCEGSGDEIRNRSREIQSRFDALSQSSLESQELCEEATSAMQKFQTEFDSFVHWLEGMEGKLAERRKTKYPIGTVQNELEEHYVSSDSTLKSLLQPSLVPRPSHPSVCRLQY